MPNGKLLFCPLICSQGCSSCTILFLKPCSCWPLPTPTLLPHPTSKYCLWRMDSVSHLTLRLVTFDFRSSENKPISWSDLATTFTRIYRGGEPFYKLVGKNSYLDINRLINLCLTKGRCRVRCFREYSSSFDENCGVILARNQLVLFGQSWVDQCVVGWTYFKDSLYDTKQLLIQLH